MSNNNSLNKYQNIINYKDYEDNRKKTDKIKIKNPFEKSNSNESISQEKYISHSNSSLSRESKSVKSLSSLILFALSSWLSISERNLTTASSIALFSSSVIIKSPLLIKVSGVRL